MYRYLVTWVDEDGQWQLDIFTGNNLPAAFTSWLKAHPEVKPSMVNSVSRA
jgi:hypothetical protein